MRNPKLAHILVVPGWGILKLQPQDRFIHLCEVMSNHLEFLLMAKCFGLNGLLVRIVWQVDIMLLKTVQLGDWVDFNLPCGLRLFLKAPFNVR